jgi:putative ABC transport system substrate-binding protein
MLWIMYLGTLALLLVALPLGGEAQQPAKLARIGYLSALSASADSTHREAFRQGLRDLGYVEGQNAVVEARYADGKFERLPDLAAEIVRLKVDVIVAAPTPAIRAAQQATRTVPIVMAFSGDPVGEGFVTDWRGQVETSPGFRPWWARWRRRGWNFSR